MDSKLENMVALSKSLEENSITTAVTDLPHQGDREIPATIKDVSVLADMSVDHLTAICTPSLSNGTITPDGVSISKDSTNITISNTEPDVSKGSASCVKDGAMTPPSDSNVRNVKETEQETPSKNSIDKESPETHGENKNILDDVQNNLKGEEKNVLIEKVEVKLKQDGSMLTVQKTSSDEKDLEKSKEKQVGNEGHVSMQNVEIKEKDASNPVMEEDKQGNVMENTNAIDNDEKCNPSNIKSVESSSIQELCASKCLADGVDIRNDIKETISNQDLSSLNYKSEKDEKKLLVEESGVDLVDNRKLNEIDVSKDMKESSSALNSCSLNKEVDAVKHDELHRTPETQEQNVDNDSNLTDTSTNVKEPCSLTDNDGKNVPSAYLEPSPSNDQIDLDERQKSAPNCQSCVPEDDVKGKQVLEELSSCAKKPCKNMDRNDIAKMKESNELSNIAFTSGDKSDAVGNNVVSETPSIAAEPCTSIVVDSVERKCSMETSKCTQEASTGKDNVDVDGKHVSKETPSSTQEPCCSRDYIDEDGKDVSENTSSSAQESHRLKDDTDVDGMDISKETQRTLQNPFSTKSDVDGEDVSKESSSIEQGLFSAKDCIYVGGESVSKETSNSAQEPPSSKENVDVDGKGISKETVVSAQESYSSLIDDEVNEKAASKETPINVHEPSTSKDNINVKGDGVSEFQTNVDDGSTVGIKMEAKNTERINHKQSSKPEIAPCKALSVVINHTEEMKCNPNQDTNNDLKISEVIVKKLDKSSKTTKVKNKQKRGNELVQNKEEITKSPLIVLDKLVNVGPDSTMIFGSKPGPRVDLKENTLKSYIRDEDAIDLDTNKTLKKNKNKEIKPEQSKGRKKTTKKKENLDEASDQNVCKEKGPRKKGKVKEPTDNDDDGLLKIKEKNVKKRQTKSKTPLMKCGEVESTNEDSGKVNDLKDDSSDKAKLPTGISTEQAPATENVTNTEAPAKVKNKNPKKKKAIVLDDADGSTQVPNIESPAKKPKKSQKKKTPESNKPNTKAVHEATSILCSTETNEKEADSQSQSSNNVSASELTKKQKQPRKPRKKKEPASNEKSNDTNDKNLNESQVPKPKKTRKKKIDSGLVCKEEGAIKTETSKTEVKRKRKIPTKYLDEEGNPIEGISPKAKKIKAMNSLSDEESMSPKAKVVKTAKSPTEEESASPKAKVVKTAKSPTEEESISPKAKVVKTAKIPSEEESVSPKAKVVKTAKIPSDTESISPKAKKIKPTKNIPEEESVASQLKKVSKTKKVKAAKKTQSEESTKPKAKKVKATKNVAEEESDVPQVKKVKPPKSSPEEQSISSKSKFPKVTQNSSSEETISPKAKKMKATKNLSEESKLNDEKDCKKVSNPKALNSKTNTEVMKSKPKSKKEKSSSSSDTKVDGPQSKKKEKQTKELKLKTKAEKKSMPEGLTSKPLLTADGTPDEECPISELAAVQFVVNAIHEEACKTKTLKTSALACIDKSKKDTKSPRDESTADKIPPPIIDAPDTVLPKDTAVSHLTLLARVVPPDDKSAPKATATTDVTNSPTVPKERITDVWNPVSSKPDPLSTGPCNTSKSLDVYDLIDEEDDNVVPLRPLARTYDKSGISSKPSGSEQENTSGPCQKCSLILPVSKLAKHVEHCTGKGNTNQGDEKKHKCNVCGFRSKWKFLIRKHLVSVHGTYACQHCEHTEKDEESFYAHQKEKHPDKPGSRSCKRCSTMVLAGQDFEEHVQNCKGKQPIVCQECKQEFKYNSLLKVHMKTHFPDLADKKFMCHKCQYHTADRSNLQKHIHAMHTENKTFIPCPICKNEFPSKVSLRKHMKLHTDQKPYICPSCDKGFKDNNGLKTHMESHNPENSFMCDIAGCTKGFRTSRKLKSHKNEFHELGTKNYRCTMEDCTQEFFKKSHLTRHIATHTDERKFKCDWDDCDKAFRHADNLRVHKRTHTNEKPFACELCDFTGRQKASLQWHIKKHHPEVASSPRKEGEKESPSAKVIAPDVDETKQISSSNAEDNLATKPKEKEADKSKQILECPLCKEVFSTKVSLRKHMQTHGDEKAYVCNTCQKGFRDDVGLKLHMETHNPDNTYICNIGECKKGFRTTRQLKLHKNESHDQASKNYQCEVEGCLQEFAKKSYLNRHLATHTGKDSDERKFKCDWEDCDKAFRHADNLKVHKRTHTNEKPFACELCDFTGRQKSSLQWHIKKHHPEVASSPKKDGANPVDKQVLSHTEPTLTEQSEEEASQYAGGKKATKRPRKKNTASDGKESSTSPPCKRKKRNDKKSKKIESNATETLEEKQANDEVTGDTTVSQEEMVDELIKKDEDYDDGDADLVGNLLDDIPSEELMEEADRLNTSGESLSKAHDSGVLESPMSEEVVGDPNMHLAPKPEESPSGDGTYSAQNRRHSNQEAGDKGPESQLHVAGEPVPIGSQLSGVEVPVIMTQSNHHQHQPDDVTPQYPSQAPVDNANGYQRSIVDTYYSEQQAQMRSSMHSSTTESSASYPSGHGDYNSSVPAQPPPHIDATGRSMPYPEQDNQDVKMEGQVEHAPPPHAYNNVEQAPNMYSPQYHGPHTPHSQAAPVYNNNNSSLSSDAVVTSHQHPMDVAPPPVSINPPSTSDISTSAAPVYSSREPAVSSSQYYSPPPLASSEYRAPPGLPSSQDGSSSLFPTTGSFYSQLISSDPVQPLTSAASSLTHPGTATSLPQPDQRTSAFPVLPGSNPEFLRSRYGSPSLLNSTSSQSSQQPPGWPPINQDDRTRAWPQPPLGPLSSELGVNSSLASKDPYYSDPYYSGKPSSLGMPPPPTDPMSHHLDMASRYMAGRHHFNSSYIPPTNPSKAYEDVYRHSAMSEYRTYAPTPGSSDVFGRMGMNPPLSLEKYYYGRDSMYRSQNLPPGAPSSFMTQTPSGAQIPPYPDYTRNPTSMYGQPNPYNFMAADKNYLASRKLGQDYFPGGPHPPPPPGPPNLTQDPHLPNPYRSSVFYNMMNRYFE